MTITIKYFASLKEKTGIDTEQLPIESMKTVQDVWDIINQNYDLSGDLLVAVNQEYAELSSAIADGDEVAFFPPVTGG
jgi:sulfur-carrier protein